jgi:hypothetical protein
LRSEKSTPGALPGDAKTKQPVADFFGTLAFKCRSPHLNRVNVGESEIAQAFYAGRYAAVLEATVDNPAGFADVDIGFAVGALSFVNRNDEAQAVFEAWRARGGTDVRTRVLCHFFIGLAFARGGQFARSEQFLVTANFASRRSADPWARALIFQGLACQRYFTGQLAAAERNALRALRMAHRSSFAYAVLLSTDLRGHALIQLGRLERGAAVLEQNRRQAQKLRLDQNVFAIDCALATYTAVFRPTQEALDRLNTLMKKKAHDSYSQRSLLNERAVLLAMRGERRDALASLALADAQALRGDTRRAKVGNLLARLRTMRFTHGAAALGALIDQALTMTDASELGYRAQALAFAMLADPNKRASAEAELLQLAAASDSYFARAALAQFTPGETTYDPFAEDQLTPLLRGVSNRDARLLARIIDAKLFGLIPELFGFTPAQRVIVVPAEDVIIIEGNDSVVVQKRPPRWVPALLSVLAAGEASKEQIAAHLWGRHEYHPLRHDPPVRTTIHRLRTFLAPHGDFVRVSDSGYALTVALHLAGALPEQPKHAPLWDRDEAPVLSSRSVTTNVSVKKRRHEDVVLERLSELEQATVTELAHSLDASVSTVLRALRQLVKERRVVRFGKARATRYKPNRGLTAPVG